MQCEICGKSFSTGKKVELDGTLMFACEDCAGFGKAKEDIRPIVREKPRQNPNAGRHGTAGQAFAPAPKTLDTQFDFGLDLAPDFGRKIRHAREKQGMTIEELGLKAYVPASEIRRIESQSLKPNDLLIKKLESCLGISLKEKSAGKSAPEGKTATAQPAKNALLGGSTHAFTLGDMIKRKSEEKQQSEK
ncbi:MAG: TIGR00270 family protein [Candidatus Diapherotrites archaeon]|nr:TIGR00270 family protein [Candidatus Diapherotrites archaeon]